MKRTFHGFGGLLVAAALVFAVTAPVLAQTPVAPVILVVDVQAIMRDAKASKSIQQQIEGQRGIYQKELANQENGLRVARDEIEQQRASLSNEALNAKGKEFQEKLADLERNTQTKRQILERSNGNAMKQVLDTMLSVVSDIAVERKANLVLPKSEVVLVDKSLDITEEAMKRIDQKLPNVAVKMETAPAAGGAPAAAAAPAKPKAPAPAAAPAAPAAPKKTTP